MSGSSAALQAGRVGFLELLPNRPPLGANREATTLDLSAATTSMLRMEVEALKACNEREAALDRLDCVGSLVDMPLMTSARDVAQPYHGESPEALLRRNTWPEDLPLLWRHRDSPLHGAFHDRCRLTHLPFVTDLEDVLSSLQRAPCGRAGRRHAIPGLLPGLRSLITVPVHMPLGQVAMMTWAGPRSAAAASAVLEAVGVELLAAAHYAVRILHVPVADLGHAPEPFRLTPREWDCLRLTAQGFRETDVARLVAIAPTTVRYHIDNVVKKLNASNRTHAVAMAAQLGLLGPIGV